MRTHFGSFVLDGESRQLLSEGTPVRLTPKAYRLLALLVEACPRALSKDELQQALWPSTFVDEANLSVLVAEVRSALGDDARQPRFVRTVHGFGYAFAAEVTRDEGSRPGTPSPWWLVGGDSPLRLAEGMLVVGREPGADVWLDSASVSRRHARLVVAGSGVTVEDLGSKNGTAVNGRTVEGVAVLEDDDELRFGAVIVRLRRDRADASTVTLAR